MFDSRYTPDHPDAPILLFGKDLPTHPAAAAEAEAFPPVVLAGAAAAATPRRTDVP